MAEEQKARCLCGSVTFRATPTKDEMGVCHCSMCRKWAGGVSIAVECESPVIFDSDETLGVFVSSEWGERLFCTKCGSSLLWRSRDGGHVAVATPAFEDPERFAFTSQIFIDDKPANYAFANETRNMTGAEVYALFAGAKEH